MPIAERDKAREITAHLGLSWNDIRERLQKEGCAATPERIQTLIKRLRAVAAKAAEECLGDSIDTLDFGESYTREGKEHGNL